MRSRQSTRPNWQPTSRPSRTGKRGQRRRYIPFKTTCKTSQSIIWFFFFSQAEERSRLDESLRQYTEAYEASAAELEKARAAAAAAAAAATTSTSAADDGASEAVRRRLEAEVEEMNQVCLFDGFLNYTRLNFFSLFIFLDNREAERREVRPGGAPS